MRNFARMADYMNISSFFIGVTTTFFTIFALHILFWRKGRTHFQTILGYIMAIWAIWNAKDLIVTFPGMYRKEVLNWIFLIDGWSALAYTAFVFEVVSPKWTTWRRMLLLSVPFATFTLAFLLRPGDEMVYAYAAFLWFYAWTIVGIGWVKVQRQIKYVRDNFSNIDRIDVVWLKPVFAFAIVSQLAWLATSLYADVVADIFYYISVILLWLMVLKYSWNFHPIEMETAEKAPASQKPTSPINEGALEQVVEEQRLYLNKNLTLADLAMALGTNRTYVSNYLSKTRGQTFYDYINEMRIIRMSIPLMREHPEYKLEHIASESGFASMSTFRRAFTKLTGQVPSQFTVTEE